MPLTLVGVSLESSQRQVEKDSVLSDAVLSDGDLIRRICAGEVLLFERVMRRHNARVFRAVRAILGSEHAAEAVMQRVYLETYKRLQDFEGQTVHQERRGQTSGAGQSRFANWLLRIAVFETRAFHQHGSGDRALRDRGLPESSLSDRNCGDHNCRDFNWGERPWNERRLDDLSLNQPGWEGAETEMSNLSAASTEARGLNGVQLDEAACRDGDSSPEAACVEAEHHSAGRDSGVVSRGSVSRGGVSRGGVTSANGMESGAALVASISAEGKQHLLATVEAAIDALPEALRTVLVLCRVEHLSVAETAAALDLSEEVVNTRLHQARAMLYDNLAERAEAIAPSVYAFHLTRCDRIVAATMKQINSR